MDLEKNTYKNNEITKQLLQIKQQQIALYERQVNEATENRIFIHLRRTYILAS